MKKALISFLALSILYVYAAVGQQQEGDITFWIPLRSGVSRQEAQILRNSQYVSIKLHSVYAYYRSGFLENIKTLVITSKIALDRAGKQVESVMLNKTLAKSSESGDFIGLNDHLAILSPATPAGIQIGIGFRGIGEDRFRKVFELLSGSELKTPLDLSDVTVSKVAGISSIIRKFLATPYTSANPRQMLDITQSLLLYSDNSKEYPDALCEGYLIVVSGREKKTDQLSQFLQLKEGDIQLSPQGQALQYRSPQGNMVTLTRNSYVILSITKTPVRGEDENSAWFNKYVQAEGACSKVMDGKDVKDVLNEALDLWKQANVLLAADLNYIHTERERIQSLYLQKIDEKLKYYSARQGQIPGGNLLKLHGSGIPEDYSKIASKYIGMLMENNLPMKDDTGNIVVSVHAKDGKSISGAPVKIKTSLTFYTATTDQQGTAVFENLPPGDYTVHANVEGYTTVTQDIRLDPVETDVAAITVVEE